MILLADRIYKHLFNDGALTTARCIDRLNARMEEIQDSLIAECARWRQQSPTSWESAANDIRTGLFQQRTSNLLGLLRGVGFYPSFDPPAFSSLNGGVPTGESVTLTATGTIYYTLDGSDPRLPGGDVSPSAFIGNSSVSIPVQGNTLVHARIRHNGMWSALASAQFHAVHSLAHAGPYVFESWEAGASSGSYPPSMQFFQSNTQDPSLSTLMHDPWSLPYDLTSRSRIIGLGSDGVGFINTANAQALPGAGYVGAAALSLDTRTTTDINVVWTGGTVVPNDRDQGIRLQYRVGDVGAFLDLLDTHGNPVEYLRNSQAGHSAVLGPVRLPVDAENQSLVQLRWIYHHRGGSSGPRAYLRLDDIQVTANSGIQQFLWFVDLQYNAIDVNSGLKLHYRHPLQSAEDWNVHVEYSDDLEDWYDTQDSWPAQVSSSQQHPDGQSRIITLQWDALPEEIPIRFLRLRVVKRSE
jgi:hypothetical protein